jgi:Flp pilus assembly protein TadG
MLGTIRRFLSDLRHNKSGNAMLLVALGMPVLIGTSGLAVDSAQYYMWKRDLQYAADQAALAGAWARTTTATQSTYAARALQEYNANAQNSADFDSAPTTQLGNWNSATNTFTANASGTAVKVTASASKSLPFTNIVTGRPVTVSVSAIATATQAGNSVTTTTTYNTLTACMIALNPSAYGAFTIGGNATGSVGCGGAALSTDPSAAIRENGNPDATFGQLVAGGGIEYSLLNNVGGDPLKLKSNTVGMVDPLGTLATPTGNGITRTYTCPAVVAGSPAYTTYYATQLLRTKVTYTYGKGKNAPGTATTYTSANPGFLANTDNNPGVTTTLSRTTGTYTASPITQAGPTVGASIAVAGSGNNTIWATPTTTTWTTITLPTPSSVFTPAVAGSDGIARPQPGTYTDISIACQTIFQSGIFVINGTIDFSQNKTVSGAGVLFVMTNANKINNINSNTNLSFSGITSALLMSDYGYSSTDAAKLAGMLFFDKLSTDQIKFNGNSTTNFNGIIYTPKRTLWFNGTSAVSGACMMLVADKLMLDGTTDMSSFCKPPPANNLEVRPQFTTTTTTPGTTATVRLVS